MGWCGDGGGVLVVNSVDRADSGAAALTARRIGGLAALLCAAALVLYWPGISMYDSTTQ